MRPAYVRPKDIVDESEFYESELATQELSCPICFEVMVPPEQAPIILFPCGHSFCKPCAAKSQESSSQCPLCRTKIKTSAPNISLQQMIVRMANRKEDVKKHSDTSVGYTKQLSMYNFRCKVLQKKKDELAEQLGKLENNLRRASLVQETLKKEEMKTLKTVTQLQEELKFIRQELEDSSRNVHNMNEECETIAELYTLTSSSLESLIQERNKCEILAQHQT